MTDLAGSVVSEKESHNEYYYSLADKLPTDITDIQDFQRLFIQIYLSHFKDGGTTKGLVRGLALRKMLQDFEASGAIASASRSSKFRILDAGCGKGELTLFLASLGFEVVAVDLSDVAISSLNERAAEMGLGQLVTGLACSLEEIPLNTGSVDAVIGFAALHHFIKYRGVAPELSRVLKAGGSCYFADGFGENSVYHLFHDKKKMEVLGDVTLTRERIAEFFGDQVTTTLYPVDWFSMLDKLYLRFSSKSLERLIRFISRLHYRLDRMIPMDRSVSLKLSGAVFTQVDTSRESEMVCFGSLPVDKIMTRDPREFIR